MHLLISRLFSFFFFPHSKKKTEDTYDLSYWDRAGNKMVLWSHLLSGFLLDVYFRLQLQFPLAETSLMLTEGSIANWISFVDQLNCTASFSDFFFLEIVNVMSPVRSDHFRVFCEQSRKSFNYTTQGEKLIFKECLYMFDNHLFCTFLSWKKSFILAYKLGQKFCFHCPSKHLGFRCIFYPTVLCLINLRSDNCTRQLFAMVLKPPVPQVQRVAAAVGLVLLCDGDLLVRPLLKICAPVCLLTGSLKYVLRFRQVTF